MPRERVKRAIPIDGVLRAIGPGIPRRLEVLVESKAETVLLKRARQNKLEELSRQQRELEKRTRALSSQIVKYQKLHYDFKINELESQQLSLGVEAGRLNMEIEDLKRAGS